MFYMKNCNYTASEEDRWPFFCPKEDFENIKNHEFTTGYFSSTLKKKKHSLVQRNVLGWGERWCDIIITGDRVCKKMNLRGQQEITKR